jgi:tetratricopeptide (TPR) repeat protein
MALRYYLQYAAMAERNEQPARAEALYEKAMAADPDSLEPYIRLAFLHLGDKKPEDAFAAMRRAALRFQDGPDEPMAHLYLGIVYSRAERYEEAVAAFRRTEALARRLPDPETVLNATFAFSYGAACERLGRFDEAVTLLEQAIAMDPDHAEALNYLAYMWAERAVRLDEALALVEHALELEPDNGAFVDTLGWIYFQMRRFPEALEALARAHDLMPEDPTVLDHLGDAYAELDRFEEAIAAWTLSLDRAPDNEGVRRKLAELGADPPVPPSDAP